MMRIVVISLTFVFCLSVGIADAQNISDAAMRHFDRGQAAVEMATSPTDYEDAVKEFEKAAKLAPGWPDVYYNLGLIQEKLSKYDDSIKNFKKYLKLSPNTTDAREVKRFVAKMEYKKEKIEEELNITNWLRGKWFVNPGPNNCIGWPVQFIIEGDLVYFYAQTAMDIDKSTLSAPSFYNYQKILVTRKGKDIQFSVSQEAFIKSRGDKWTRDAQYNIKLIDHGKLEGTVNFDGKTRKAYFWRE